MIDGVKLDVPILLPFQKWKQIVGIETFEIDVFIEDGSLKAKTRGNTITTTYTANWRSYTLTFRETETTTGSTTTKKQHLQINGSVHKSYFKGNNYQPFTWDCLQQEINNLCTGLQLNPSKVKISNIEIGVNVPLEFEVNTFIFKDIIHYMNNKFNQYSKDNQGIELGIELKLTDYVVKIYNKGLQYNLDNRLLRIEKRFHKMKRVNKVYNISTLADLQTISKVKPLVNELLTMWANVLVFDFKKDYSHRLIGKWINPNFWNDSTRNKRKVALKQCKEFLKLKGSCKHEIITRLLTNEWQQLITNNVTFSPTVRKSTVIKEFTFSPSVQELPAPNNKGIKNKKCYDFTNTVNGENVTTRFCKTCKKDISHQQKKSIFCSAKYVGYKAAHKCRNDKTNPKNNLKNKLVKLESKGLLFDIMPFIVKKNKVS